MGLPHILDRYTQIAGTQPAVCIMVDREGMKAKFLAELVAAGYTVITLLKSNQYTGIAFLVVVFGDPGCPDPTAAYQLTIRVATKWLQINKCTGQRDERTVCFLYPFAITSSQLLI